VSLPRSSSPALGGASLLDAEGVEDEEEFEAQYDEDDTEMDEAA
jgi:hypothetical protein